MFTGITLIIPQTTADGPGIDKVITVPVEYGPKQKWFVENTVNPNKGITSNPGNNNQIPFARLLPRIVYEMTNMQYDPSRKISGATKNVVPNGDATDSAVVSFVPVPWSFGFQVSIGTKNMDDMSQILEQILPYFQPHFTVRVIYDANVPEYDSQILLENIQTNIDWIDDMGSIRKIEADIQFQFNGMLFLPYANKTAIINYVDINYHPLNSSLSGEKQHIVADSELITPL